MPKKSSPSNCAFCTESIPGKRCKAQREHTARHAEELTDIYHRIGEEEGLDIRFGSDCHSVCCHLHTVQLKPVKPDYVNVGAFIHSFRHAIHSIFLHPFIHSTRVRAQFIVYATFASRKEWIGKRVENTTEANFHSKMQTVTPTGIDEMINDVIGHIEPKVEKFCHEKSGWSLTSFDALSIKLVCGVNHSGGGPVIIPTHLKKCHYVKVLRGKTASNHCFETAVRFFPCTTKRS